VKLDPISTWVDDHPYKFCLAVGVFYLLAGLTQMAFADETPQCQCYLDGGTWYRSPDNNSDGHVDVRDYLRLLAFWGPVEGCGWVGDINCDGDVGTPDVLILLAAWGHDPLDYDRCHF
jgi:hypothetical protein